MRLVHFQEFIEMPTGTVYAKYKRCDLQEICVKYTDKSLDKYKWKPDWWYASFSNVEELGTEQYPEAMLRMEDNPQLSVPISTAVDRDGMYHESQMFMIYEKPDIDYIVSMLTGGNL